MTGKPLIIRPTRLETSIPEDLRAKLDLHLQSQVEGRIPKGAYQRFILDLIREFFAKKQVPKTTAAITKTESEAVLGAIAYTLDNQPQEEYSGEAEYLALQSAGRKLVALHKLLY